MQTEDLQLDHIIRYSKHAIVNKEVLCCHQPNLTLNKCCQRQIIKKVSEKLPNVGIAILPQALVIKSIPDTRTVCK